MKDLVGVIGAPLLLVAGFGPMVGGTVAGDAIAYNTNLGKEYTSLLEQKSVQEFRKLEETPKTVITLPQMERYKHLQQQPEVARYITVNREFSPVGYRFGGVFLGFPVSIGGMFGVAVGMDWYENRKKKKTEIKKKNQ